MQIVRVLAMAAAIFEAASASPTIWLGEDIKFVQRAPRIPIAPRALEDASATNMPAANPAPPGSQTVIVKKGQTLGDIAKQFGVGICDIAKASNLPNPNVINTGDTLTIPAPTGVKDDTSCLPPSAPPATAACVLGGPDRFTVPSGGLTAETAARFLNITLDALAAANAKAVPAVQAATNLTGNMILTVPVCPGSTCTIGQATVKSGDIFDSIAAAAGSTTGQILALNPGIDRFNLAIGQTFTLPSKCKNGTAAAAPAAPAATGASPPPSTP